MDIKRDIRFRVYVSFTCIVLFAGLILAKAAFIQIKEGDELKKMAVQSSTKTEIIEADRGNIYTEDGTLLSSSIPQFDLRVDFKAIPKDTFSKYIDTLSRGLAGILKDGSAVDYKNKLQVAFKKGERYFLLKKNAPFYQYQLVRNLPPFNKGKYKGGFIIEPKSKRVNPYGMLAYRTIGLWRKNVDNIGLEQKYDTVLSGHEGSRVVRRTRGAWIPIEGSEIDPQNGQDIVTTIDINIQDVAENALLEAVEKYRCQFGTAIVMETKTGKIRALANLGRQSDGSYWEDFNYATIPSEPGSTFKLMTMFSVLEDGYLTIDDQVNAQGGIAYFGKQRVVDDHKGYGMMTLKKAFAKSSNVVFAKLASQYYSKKPMKFIEHLQHLKLHQKSGIDLTGERPPLIKTTKSKSWNSTTSLAWIGYGYESLITPLHTCMVYNGVANNGKMMKPYLVSEIKEYGKVIKKIEPTVLVEKMGKPSTIRQLQLAARAVVEEGTAKGVKSPFYETAGKTGTAQVADKGISYKDGVRQGSFVGYFPFDNPQYTIMVLVRSTPHGPYYGAVVAAPVFKKIADKLYATHIGGWKVNADTLSSNATIVAKKSINGTAGTLLQQVEYGVNSKSATVQQTITQFSKPDKFLDHIMPDLNGYGLKDAIMVMENAGLEVSFQGKGKVMQQSIVPGSKIQRGQKVYLLLG